MGRRLSLLLIGNDHLVTAALIWAAIVRAAMTRSVAAGSSMILATAAVHMMIATIWPVAIVMAIRAAMTAIISIMVVAASVKTSAYVSFVSIARTFADAAGKRQTRDADRSGRANGLHVHFRISHS